MFSTLIIVKGYVKFVLSEMIKIYCRFINYFNSKYTDFGHFLILFIQFILQVQTIECIMTNVLRVDLRVLHCNRINSFHDEWYPCPSCIYERAFYRYYLFHVLCS